MVESWWLMMVHDHYIMMIIDDDESEWILVGGFNPWENSSQLGWFFTIYGKIKNVPNHQPD